jgi:hypothetical protein
MRPEIILIVATAALAHPTTPQHIYYEVPATTQNENSASSLKRKFIEDTSPSRIITSDDNLQHSAKRHSSDTTWTKPPPFFNPSRLSTPHHVAMNQSAHPEYNEYYELEKRQLAGCICWIPLNPKDKWERSDYMCHGEKLRACFKPGNPCKPL